VTINERLVRLLVSRSERLTSPSSVDRTATLTLDGIPARAIPPRPSRPSTPWNALIAQLSVNGTIDASSHGDQLLDVILANDGTSPDELRSLLARPGLTPEQRTRVLRHPYVPGDLVIDHLCDERRDRAPFTEADLRDQLAMLQQIAGIGGEERLNAWAVLTVRCATAPSTEALVGDVLIASPVAEAVLHEAVALALRRTRRLPEALERHLLSHLATPATIASLALRDLIRMLERSDQTGAPSSRFEDVICDLIAATCETDPARWASFFSLSEERPDDSLRRVLDEVEASDPGDGSPRRRRRDVPGYQRHPGSPLLKPIEYAPARR
jgi:hypothetical protein